MKFMRLLIGGLLLAFSGTVMSYWVMRATPETLFKEYNLPIVLIYVALFFVGIWLLVKTKIK